MALSPKFKSSLTTLLASTYLGGTGADMIAGYGNVMVLDTLGNIYVAGYTNSDNFPTTTGAYQINRVGTYDAFISKFGNPVPTITSLSPSEVYNDHGAFTLTINGTGFNVSTTASYAGSSKTVAYVSSTQITIDLVSTDLGTDGLNYKGVKVTNVEPGGGGSNTVNMTVRLRVGSSASVSSPTTPTPPPAGGDQTPAATPAPVVTTPVVVPTEIIESPVTTPIVETPAPVVVTYVFKKDLKSGMTNSDVKKLQIFLNTHGFKIATKGAGSPGKETNFFGSATRNAIMKFQKANKIKPVNGLLGPLTRAAINKIK